MNWDDLMTSWKRQEEEAVPSDLTSLNRTFETERLKLAGRLYWRDLREAFAGLIAAIFFATRAWQMGKAVWPIAIAVALILGVTAFFIAERIRIHRNRLGTDAPLLAKLEAEIAELQHQRNLLMNIGKWYLGPLVAAWAIVLTTIIIEAPTHKHGHQLLLDSYVIDCVFLFWWILRKNHRTSRKKIEPRLAELEKLRNHLLSPE